MMRPKMKVNIQKKQDTKILLHKLNSKQQPVEYFKFLSTFTHGMKIGVELEKTIRKNDWESIIHCQKDVWRSRDGHQDISL